jgi:hypothetical protein
MVAGLEHDQHRAEDVERYPQGHAAKDQLSTATAEARLLTALVAAGLAPRPAPLNDADGSPILAGHSVVLGRTEIVFRLFDPATVLLVRIQRVETAPGLDSPLQGIARFVALLAHGREETGVRRVLGIVATGPYRALGGLDDERLAAFYRRLHGAEWLQPDQIPGLSKLDRQLAAKPGSKWVGLELDRFKGTRPRA